MYIYTYTYTVFHIQRDTTCCWPIKYLPSMHVHRDVGAHTYLSEFVTDDCGKGISLISLCFD